MQRAPPLHPGQLEAWRARLTLLRARAVLMSRLKVCRPKRASEEADRLLAAAEEQGVFADDIKVIAARVKQLEGNVARLISREVI